MHSYGNGSFPSLLSFGCLNDCALEVQQHPIRLHLEPNTIQSEWGVTRGPRWGVEYWFGSSSAPRGSWVGNYAHYQLLTESATALQTGREFGLVAGGNGWWSWGGVYPLGLEAWAHKHLWTKPFSGQWGLLSRRETPSNYINSGLSFIICLLFQHQ